MAAGMLLPAISLTGCASVYFGKRIQNGPIDTISDRAAQSSTVRIFIDRHGDLYPPADFPVPELKGTVQGYVLHNRQVEENCKQERHLQKSLCIYVNNHQDADSQSKDARWTALQHEYWTDVAQRVVQAATLSNGERRPIVFLVHGFNNPLKDIESMFDETQKRIEHHLADQTIKPLYVEVFWDGRRSFVKLGVWKYAQPTASIVGFQLRQLLNGIAGSMGSDTPVRYIGHSSGGIIAAALMGDTTPVLPGTYPSCCEAQEKLNFRTYCRYSSNKDETSKYAIPMLTNYRVGLLAAATPPDSLIGVENGDGAKKGGITRGHQRLVLSLNRQDSALNPSCWIGNRAGNACLGSHKKSQSRVEDHFNKVRAAGGGNLEFRQVIFKGQFSHNIVDYLENPAMNEFLTLVFEES